MTTYVCLALIIIGIILLVINSINNSKKLYLKYLKCNLPTVAENVIQRILDNIEDYTIADIISSYNNSDLYLSCIDFVRDEMNKYIDKYIDLHVNDGITGKIVSKIIKNKITSDISIIDDAIDLTLIHNGSNGESMYNELIKLLSNYSSDKLSEMEKEDKEAQEIAEAYENESVEDVAEYNGEFDKSEFDIARENFEPLEVEYPEEENLDEIPEELVEIVEQSKQDDINK